MMKFSRQTFDGWRGRLTPGWRGSGGAPARHRAAGQFAESQSRGEFVPGRRDDFPTGALRDLALPVFAALEDRRAARDVPGPKTRSHAAKVAPHVAAGRGAGHEFVLVKNISDFFHKILAI